MIRRIATASSVLVALAALCGAACAADGGQGPAKAAPTVAPGTAPAAGATAHPTAHLATPPSLDESTTTRSTAAGTTVTTTRAAGEPAVQWTVIDDDGPRVEELRVRGEVQRIVVKPRGGRGAEYEIITANGSRDLSDGPMSSKGTAGQRVWNVLHF